jgi:hypothetical protein
MRRTRLLHLAFICALVCAAVVRFQYVGESRIISERQFRTAVIARANYFQLLDSVPAWRQAVASTQKTREGVLEPPVLEWVAAISYRIIGRESFRIGQAISGVFWLIGGVFLYGLIRRIGTPAAAIAGTVYYLFVPLGVVISVSFVPDTLMMMLFLAGLLATVRYHERASLPRLILAASVCGLAIVLRPLVLFTLLAAFVALAIHNIWCKNRVAKAHLALFASLSLLPTVLFYGYGVFLAGFLRWKVQTSFVPSLWFHYDYWKGWLLSASDAVGPVWLIAAFVGILLARGVAKALLVGLSVGYVIFCLVFTYHIRFANYYHLQLIVIVALALGPLLPLIVDRLKQLSMGRYEWIQLAGALLVAAFVTLGAIDQRMAAVPRIEDEAVFQEVGEIVRHSTRTLYVSSYYGKPLEYFSELAGWYWPRSNDSAFDRRAAYRDLTVEERLSALDAIPEYVVVTDFDQFDRLHGDLEDYLKTKCAVVAANMQYVIYNSCDLGNRRAVGTTQLPVVPSAANPTSQ